MSGQRSLMLLAGSAEARAVAAALTDAGVPFKALITEPPKGVRPLEFEAELLQFSDAHEMKAYLAEAQVDAVLDASHGFDGDITAFGYHAAMALELDHLRLERPLWTIEDHTNWRKAPDLTSAMSMIGPETRVFSATGWEGVFEYATFKGEVVYLRQTHQTDRTPPFPFMKSAYGKPPFTVDDEIALFQDLKIDLLICRNLGGQASRPKLDAARNLGLKVILIDPPKPPNGMTSVQDIDKAVTWAKSL